MSEIEETKALSKLDEITIDTELITEIFHDKNQNHVAAYNEGLELLKVCQNNFLSDSLSVETKLKFFMKQKEIFLLLNNFKLSDPVEIYKKYLTPRLDFVRSLDKDLLSDEDIGIVKDSVDFHNKSFVQLLRLMKKDEDNTLELNDWNENYLRYADVLKLTKKDIADFAYLHKFKYLLLGGNSVRILKA